MALLTFVIGPALLGLLGAALIGFVLWLVFLVVAGLVDGLLLTHAGKGFSGSGPALARHPGFGKGCKIVGRISTGMSIAIVVCVIASFILPTWRSSGQNTLATIGAYLVLLAILLLFLETPMLIVVSVMFIRVFRLNRKLATPAVNRILAVFCLILGIITLLVCGIALLTFGGVILLSL